MQQCPFIFYSFQLKVTVFCDCHTDQLIKGRICYKPTNHLLRSKKKICSVHRMIHSPRLKAVKSFDLLKSSYIMKQANDLGQLNVFLSQMHPGSNLLCGIHHTIGMYDFQMNLVICSVILIQILFKSCFCHFKIYMQFLFLHRFSSWFTTLLRTSFAAYIFTIFIITL